MNLEIVRVGYLKTNCCVLEKDGCVLVIDPGDDYEKIIESIGEKEMLGIFVTHHHPDHVGALEYFDAGLVYDYSNLKEGTMELGPFKFEVIFTPGHKDDSITLYFEEDKKMFTGDFLFKGTIGRTDFPGGSMTDMISSIERIKNYPLDTEIIPGHGLGSILGVEIENCKEYF